MTGPASGGCRRGAHQAGDNGSESGAARPCNPNGPTLAVRSSKVELGRRINRRVKDEKAKSARAIIVDDISMCGDLMRAAAPMIMRHRKQLRSEDQDDGAIRNRATPARHHRRAGMRPLYPAVAAQMMPSCFSFSSAAASKPSIA